MISEEYALWQEVQKERHRLAEAALEAEGLDAEAQASSAHCTDDEDVMWNQVCIAQAMETRPVGGSDRTADYAVGMVDALPGVEEADGGLSVKLLDPDSKLPTRESEHAAGLDLSSVDSVRIEPWSKAAVRTGIAVALPRGTYGRIAPRSGLAAKHSIMINAGVVDPDYRGELLVLMHNLSHTPFVIESGDRIAQLVLERVSYPNANQCKYLPKTERGNKGLGSTGVKNRAGGTGCTAGSAASAEAVPFEAGGKLART